MDSNYEKILKQQLVVFNNLKGDLKRDYFLNVFNSCLINALVYKRKYENISQTDIASLMGVKQSYVSKIESLKKMPTIETIAKYCYALNFGILEIKKMVEEISSCHESIPNFYVIYKEEKKEWNKNLSTTLLRQNNNRAFSL